MVAPHHTSIIGISETVRRHHLETQPTPTPPQGVTPYITAPKPRYGIKKTLPGKHTLKGIVVEASEASAVDQITVCKIL